MRMTRVLVVSMIGVSMGGACEGSDAGVDADAVARVDADAHTGGETGPVEFHVSLIESASADAPDERTAFAIAGRIFEESTEGGETIGDCTFYPALPPPFCDPVCGVGTICVDDGVCGPPLEPLDAGEITVTGLAVGLELTAQTQYFYYSPSYTPEPDNGDLFVAGAALTATAAGGNVPAFTLEVAGVSDLTSSLACPPDLDSGSDLVVRWPAGDGATMHLDLESGNHGGQFARIACDTNDDGELVVDGALITKYLASPRPLDLWRLARRNVTIGGGVRFEAASHVGCRW